MVLPNLSPNAYSLPISPYCCQDLARTKLAAESNLDRSEKSIPSEALLAT